MSNKVGKRIQELMIRNGMTQKELAYKTGITTVSISRYIKGERIPDCEKMGRIAMALHADANVLLGIREEWNLSEEEFAPFIRRIGEIARCLSKKQKADLILTIMGVNND